MLLVRHAECQMNLDLASRVGGRSNESPLTPKGVRQVRRWRSALPPSPQPALRRPQATGPARLQAEALGRHLATSVAKHAELGPCFTSTAVRAVDTLTIALAAARQAGHAYLCSPQVGRAAGGQAAAMVQGATQHPPRPRAAAPAGASAAARGERAAAGAGAGRLGGPAAGRVLHGDEAGRRFATWRTRQFVRRHLRQAQSS